MFSRSQFSMIIPGMLFAGMLLISCFTAYAADSTDYYIPPPPPMKVSAGPVWTAQDLLKPDMFPNAQFGMALVSAEDGPIAKVITTGGEFIINKAADTIECKQRIAKKRSVAIIKLTKGTLAGIKLTDKSSGAAIFGGNGSIVRINGDSLMMIQPGRSGDLKAELSFTPDYFADYIGNYNFYDPYGGISFFEHGKCPNSDFYAVTDPVTVTWPWKKGNVFWACVSPPKPFDWDASYKMRISWYGSSMDRYMYLSDHTLKMLNEYFGITQLVLFNEWWESMDWLDVADTDIDWNSDKWNKPLNPKYGDRYIKLVRACKEAGILMTPYTTPFNTGGNELLYLRQASRLVNNFETKGLYFDEMYRTVPWMATAYHFVRSTRQLVGDDGVLIYHGADDIPIDRREGVGEKLGKTSCPVVHAYLTILYKAEGEWNRWGDDFVRYRVGTYNISNVIGCPVMDNRYLLTPEKIDYYIRKGNLRLWLAGSDIYDGRIKSFQYYWSRLNPSLKKEIEPELLKPTGSFQRFRDSIKHQLAQK